MIISIMLFRLSAIKEFMLSFLTFIFLGAIFFSPILTQFCILKLISNATDDLYSINLILYTDSEVMILMCEINHKYQIKLTFVILIFQESRTPRLPEEPVREFI